MTTKHIYKMVVSILLSAFVLLGINNVYAACEEKSTDNLLPVSVSEIAPQEIVVITVPQNATYEEKQQAIYEYILENPQSQQPRMAGFSLYATRSGNTTAVDIVMNWFNLFDSVNAIRFIKLDFKDAATGKWLDLLGTGYSMTTYNLTTGIAGSKELGRIDVPTSVTSLRVTPASLECYRVETGGWDPIVGIGDKDIKIS